MIGLGAGWAVGWPAGWSTGGSWSSGTTRSLGAGRGRGRPGGPPVRPRSRGTARPCPCSPSRTRPWSSRWCAAGTTVVLAGAAAGTTVVDLSTASPGVDRDAGRGGRRPSALCTSTPVSRAVRRRPRRARWRSWRAATPRRDASARLAPLAATGAPHGRAGAGHTAKLLNNFLNAVSSPATAEVMVAGAGRAGPRLLEVLNASSGVNFATRNRFPRIVQGDYLEGGLTSRLMTKDVVLYVELLGVSASPLNAAGPLASFGLADQPGLRRSITNRVVDAIGDVAGGVRVHDSGG